MSYFPMARIVRRNCEKVSGWMLDVAGPLQTLRLHVIAVAWMLPRPMEHFFFIIENTMFIEVVYMCPLTKTSWPAYSWQHSSVCFLDESYFKYCLSTWLNAQQARVVLLMTSHADTAHSKCGSEISRLWYISPHTSLTITIILCYLNNLELRTFCTFSHSSLFIYKRRPGPTEQTSNSTWIKHQIKYHISKVTCP